MCEPQVMDKYDALADHLASVPDAELQVTSSFTEIDRILGLLPDCRAVGTRSAPRRISR